MSKHVHLLLALVLAAAGLSPAGLLADVGWARHKKIYAVPVPGGVEGPIPHSTGSTSSPQALSGQADSTGSPQAGKVTIDAQLNDWDLSGQILMYVYRETSAMQSAQVAMMYDQDAFYISGVVRDTSPMMNRHDPKVDPERAWDADVCQIFFNLNPGLGYPVKMNQWTDNKGADKDLTDLYLWYFTDPKEPCLAMFRGLPPRPDPRYSPLGAVPADKFQAAYAKAEDSLGYTFEYRIPWTTLGAPRPLRAGDLSAGAVFVFWSDVAGLKTAGGSAWAYDVMAYPGFGYQESGCWGKFIFAGKGHLPKDLVEEGVPPEPPLPLRFAYDLPEDGFATIQLFETNGMVARLLVAQGERKAGNNVELWNGCDDQGKLLPAGTYTWRGLYHKGIKTKFCFSAHNSGQPPYKTDDNTGGWGGDHGNPTAVCAAGDRMVLTWDACESGWGIVITDLNGKKLNGLRHNAMDVTSDGARIVVAGDYGYEYAGSVKLFDLRDGRPLNWGNGRVALAPPPGSNTDINVATGVAYGNGKVYVSWGARNLVGAYDSKSGDLLATWPVPSPRRLATRPDGSVAVISETNVQFLVLSSINHQPSTINHHLDSPRGIAVDTNGNLFVANAGKLQNIAVFDKDGKYLRSIGKAGGRPAVGRYDRNGLYMPGGIGLDKQGRLWAAETTDSPKRHSVWDAGTGAWVAEFFGASSYFGWAWIDPKKPDEIYCHNMLWKIDWAKNTCAPLSTIWRATEPDMIQEVDPGGYAGHFRVVTAKNGRQFGWGMVDYSPTLFMRVGDVFKPIAGTMRVLSGRGVLYPAMQAYHAQHPAGAYLWQDQNDDQKVQPEELTVSPFDRGEETFNWIDSDLNAWCGGGLIFKPVRFAPDGRPVYDFSQKTVDPRLKGQPWDLADPDALYALSPGSGGNSGFFGRFGRDGQLVWGFRGITGWKYALNLDMGMPGKLYGLTMPLGVAGEFTGAACYACPYYLFMTDGLYVSMIMRNGRDGKLGPDITASETLTGQLVKPDGMNRYFLLAGDQDGRVTEVLGLETVKRLRGGAFTLSEADAKLAAAALSGYEAKRTVRRKLSLVRGAGALGSVAAVGKTLDAGRGFQARAAYDATNLYVAFDVTGSDLINSFSDPKLVFKGGNCLDIQLAADPAADPKRKTPASGDVRILATRRQGPTTATTGLAPAGVGTDVKPLVVIYQPKLKDFKGEPTVLTSPTGKESFDAITVTDAVGLQYAKTGGGFSATVTIPLTLIGWTPKTGASVKLDVGYLFGNATGSQCALRAYWSNNSFTANVTGDVPHESRLEPKEWSLATVE